MKKSTYKKHWPKKNLGELVNFLEARYGGAISLNELAGDLGNTVGSWSNLFNRDDMKLTKAEAIARHYGYSLTLMFPERIFESGYHPPVRVRPCTTAGNLTGMYLWIRDSGMTLKQVADRMGITPNVITKAFKTGDILISTLYLFTDTFGITVLWEFNKEEQKTKN